MTEYDFEHAATVPPGRVVVVAQNGGALEHSMTVVRLPPSFPPILRQLRSNRRRPVETLAQLPARPPGAQGTFAVDLEPGRYALVCFVEDADGRQHAIKGMASELLVS